MNGLAGRALRRVKPGVPDRRAMVHPLYLAQECLREMVDGLEERRLLDQVRKGAPCCWSDSDEPEPLVTVRVATFNRGPLVAERALASALRQTYGRLEVLVVGDCCDDATAEAVRSVRDPRVRFVNLAERGLYPTDATYRWMVAGATPMNAALSLATGKWIAPLDDDDEFTDDHVEVLLREARARGVEFVWSRARMESTAGNWRLVGSTPMAHGAITHGSVLYAAGLRFFRHSTTSWKRYEPSDWNLWHRMERAGVKMEFVDAVTYTHYLEARRRPGS